MYNILLVDDKEIFCRSILRLPFFQIPECKWRIIHTARNGVEALEYLSSEKIDVTLTDIRMPMMNGIELLKAIQKDHLCRCTILVSGYADFSYAKEGIINGAFDYLVKPVDEEKIRSTFARAEEYLQSTGSVSPVQRHEAAKLSRCVIQGNAREVETQFFHCMRRIGANFDSPRELDELGERLLNLIQGEITVEYPYAGEYIPLSLLCTLAPPEAGGGAGEKDGELQLRRNLGCLQRELQKFRLPSQHPLVRNIWCYTLTHIEQDCKLQTLAERFYVNKNYLSTMFRRETGIYYKDFVSQFRIERAKLLLLSTDLKVCDIAERMNFSDPEYFSRVFKNQVGISPSKYTFDDYLDCSQPQSCPGKPSERKTLEELWATTKSTSLIKMLKSFLPPSHMN